MVLSRPSLPADLSVRVGCHHPDDFAAGVSAFLFAAVAIWSGARAGISGCRFRDWRQLSLFAFLGYYGAGGFRLWV